MDQSRLTTYVCGQCAHEQEAEEPPLCEDCLKAWGNIKSRMTEKVEDDAQA